MLPKDPYILLSYVNTKLRDVFSNLSVFCEEEGILQEELQNQLFAIGYVYSDQTNQFQRK